MNKEYEWLLNFYLQIVSFDVVTCTFHRILKEDRTEVMKSIDNLKEKLELILPKIQDKQ